MRSKRPCLLKWILPMPKQFIVKIFNHRKLCMMHNESERGDMWKASFDWSLPGVLHGMIIVGLNFFWMFIVRSLTFELHKSAMKTLTIFLVPKAMSIILNILEIGEPRPGFWLVCRMTCSVRMRKLGSNLSTKTWPQFKIFAVNNTSSQQRSVFLTLSQNGYLLNFSMHRCWRRSSQC